MTGASVPSVKTENSTSHCRRRYASQLRCKRMNDRWSDGVSSGHSAVTVRLNFVRYSALTLSATRADQDDAHEHSESKGAHRGTYTPAPGLTPDCPLRFDAQ